MVEGIGVYAKHDGGPRSNYEETRKQSDGQLVLLPGILAQTD